MLFFVIYVQQSWRRVSNTFLLSLRSFTNNQLVTNEQFNYTNYFEVQSLGLICFQIIFILYSTVINIYAVEWTKLVNSYPNELFEHLVMENDQHLEAKVAEAENINEIVLKLSGRFCKLICTHYELLFLTSLIRFCLGELFTVVLSNVKRTLFSLWKTTQKSHMQRIWKPFEMKYGILFELLTCWGK